MWGPARSMGRLTAADLLWQEAGSGRTCCSSPILEAALAVETDCRQSFEGGGQWEERACTCFGASLLSSAGAVPYACQLPVSLSPNNAAKGSECHMPSGVNL